MNSLIVHQLSNGNYWLERVHKELTPIEFFNLQKIAPLQGWVIFQEITKGDCTNPSFDWQGHQKREQESEGHLRKL